MATIELSITLPEDLAAFVRARVSSGQYASESEVVQDGIAELIDRERSWEERLDADAVAAYDDWKANPSAVSRVEEVQARFETRWAREDGKQ